MIQAVDDIGQLDNTLIIYINGDNGTSAEGGPLGTPNEVAFFNGVSVPVDVQMKFYDVWGTEQTYNHMSAGWSWAFDTPFSWFKQNASQLGGTNQNMVVSWPARIHDKGGLREQFVHVIDVVPTILEAAGIRAPELVDGIKQAPIEGTSFAYTFDAKNAKVPSHHQTQYFEMMGQWALYHDGWFLSTKVNRAPWEAFGAANPDPLNNQVLELYDLNKDFSQSENVAAANPQKVAELKKLFIAEAKKYQVFPMDASVAARVIAPRPNITAGRKEFVYTRPMVGLPQGDSPLLLDTSYTITADIDVPQGGAEGMILTSGGRFAGYGFYLLKSKPVFLWNLVDLERVKWEGADALTPGPHTVEFDFKYDGIGVGTLEFNSFTGLAQPGTGTLKVDGVEVATKRMEKHAADDPAVGRELRHRLRHPHGRQRRGLPAAVPADRQVQQADDQGRPPAALAGRHQAAQGGDAGEGEGRLTPRSRHGRRSGSTSDLRAVARAARSRDRGGHGCDADSSRRRSSPHSCSAASSTRQAAGWRGSAASRLLSLAWAVWPREPAVSGSARAGDVGVQRARARSICSNTDCAAPKSAWYCGPR